MYERSAIIEQMTREAMDALDVPLHSDRDGVLTYRGLSEAIFHANECRLAFSNSFSSLARVPEGVEIVVPGSHTFDSVVKLIRSRPALAFASRPSRGSPPAVFGSTPRWQDCAGIVEYEIAHRSTRLFEHYFCVRFCGFSVEEIVLAVTVEASSGQVAIGECSLEKALTVENAVSKGRPEIDCDELCGSVEIAKRALHFWIEVEADERGQHLSRKRAQTELRVRNFFGQRHAERQSVERRLETRLKGGRGNSSTFARLDAIRGKHRQERSEDQDDLATRLAELERNHRLWEVQVRHVCTLIVDTQRSTRAFRVQRGGVSGIALVWQDAGDGVAKKPVCRGCYHGVDILGICDNGHIVCAGCESSCSGCHARTCRACCVGRCSTCDGILCERCRSVCLCGSEMCREHRVECAHHGWLCSACVLPCSSKDCTEVVCRVCFEKGVACARCRRAKCQNCCTMHIACGSLTCHSCSEKVLRTCVSCTDRKIQCWRCDRPGARCQVCRGQVCRACREHAVACDRCERIVCSQHAEFSLTRCSICNENVCRRCIKEKSRCRRCCQFNSDLRAHKVSRRFLLKASRGNSEDAERLYDLFLRDLPGFAGALVQILGNCDSRRMEQRVLATFVSIASRCSSDCAMWTSALDRLGKLYEHDMSYAYELAVAIEGLAPLHVLDTGMLERVLADQGLRSTNARARVLSSDVFGSTGSGERDRSHAREFRSALRTESVLAELEDSEWGCPNLCDADFNYLRK